MLLHLAMSYSILNFTLHDFISNCIALASFLRFLLDYIIVFYFIKYHIVLYYIVLSVIVGYSMLYYTMLYHTMPYNMILVHALTFDIMSV